MHRENVIKNLNRIATEIELDKARLRNVIDAIAIGDTHLDINDRLISSLGKLTYKERNVEVAVEYLTLILANIETQKINYSKQVNEELISILTHNLTTIVNMEECIQALHHNHQHEVKIPDTIITPDTGVGYLKNVIQSILPNNKVSNAVLWISVVILLSISAYIYDPNILPAISETIATVKGTKDD